MAKPPPVQVGSRVFDPTMTHPVKLVQMGTFAPFAPNQKTRCTFQNGTPIKMPLGALSLPKAFPVSLPSLP